jgi:hypothetical protein
MKQSAVAIAWVGLAIVAAGTPLVCRTWSQASEGSASAAVARRVIETAVEFHCRNGSYPASFDDMSLDLTNTDGGSWETLRWIEYESTPHWFSVRNTLMGTDGSEFPFDPSLCGTARVGEGPANLPAQPTPARGPRA